MGKSASYCRRGGGDSGYYCGPDSDAGTATQETAQNAKKKTADKENEKERAQSEEL